MCFAQLTGNKMTHVKTSQGLTRPHFAENLPKGCKFVSTGLLGSINTGFSKPVEVWKSPEGKLGYRSLGK
jgi:hypothetical protein